MRHQNMPYTVIKTMWYWYRNRGGVQWSRINIPETEPDTHENLILSLESVGKVELFNKW